LQHHHRHKGKGRSGQYLPITRQGDIQLALGSSSPVPRRPLRDGGLLPVLAIDQIEFAINDFIDRHLLELSPQLKTDLRIALHQVTRFSVGTIGRTSRHSAMSESFAFKNGRQFPIQGFVPFRIHDCPARVASRDDHKPLRPTSHRFNSIKNSLQESRSFIGGERNLIHDARSNLVPIGRAFRSRRERKQPEQGQEKGFSFTRDNDARPTPPTRAKRTMLALGMKSGNRASTDGAFVFSLF
jgi:hypothetical protein